MVHNFGLSRFARFNPNIQVVTCKNDSSSNKDPVVYGLGIDQHPDDRDHG